MLSDAALSDGNAAGGGAVGDARALLVNFVTMTFCFSVNHGTVSATIALSTSLLGTGLGSINLGTLWLMYVLTALIFATAIIQAVGAKGGLLCGTLGYCAYVASFLLAAVVAPDAAVFPPTGAQVACEAITTSNATGAFPCSFTAASVDKPAICDCAACPDTWSEFVTVGGALCVTDAVRAISLVGAAMGGVAAGFLWSAQVPASATHTRTRWRSPYPPTARSRMPPTISPGNRNIRQNKADTQQEQFK